MQRALRVAAVAAAVTAACGARQVPLPHASPQPDAGARTDRGPPAAGGDLAGGALVPAAERPAVLPAAPGACLNPADRAVLDTEAQRAALETEIDGCVARCLAAPEIERCVARCIATATALSEGCAACYVDLARCALARCAEQRLPDIGGAQPNRCALAQRCRPAFYRCAGLRPADACRNRDDEPRLDTQEERAALDALASDCGERCLWQPDLEPCAVACLGDRTVVSAGCSACYARFVVCAGLGCAHFCAHGFGDPACVLCLRERDCELKLSLCTGLVPLPP